MAEKVCFYFDVQNKVKYERGKDKTRVLNFAKLFIYSKSVINITPFHIYDWYLFPIVSLIRIEVNARAIVLIHINAKYQYKMIIIPFPFYLYLILFKIIKLYACS